MSCRVWKYVAFAAVIILGSCHNQPPTVIEEKKEDKDREIEIAILKPYIYKYSSQLNVNPEILDNEDLYQFIDGWIGVKYKWGGNTKDGVDCSGFVNQVFINVYNKPLKRSATDMVKECEMIKKDELKEGDLVFFDISSKNSHVGIYLANHRFIHASSSKGVIISDLDAEYYVKHWGRAGRIK